jgi:long-subunit fatty acid transport protein
MSNRLRAHPAYLSLGVLLMHMGNPARAQLAQNLTVGNAKALALANAVTADPPAIDSIHFNPAGLTQLKGRQYQLKIIGSHYTVSGELERSDEYQAALDQSGMQDPVTSGSSTTSDVAAMLPWLGLTEVPLMIAPVGGVSITSPEGRLTFANALYAPMMVGYRRDDNDPLRYQGTALGLTHLTLLSPTIAWRINNEWSVGGGISFNYTGMGMSMYFRTPSTVLAAVNQLAGDQCAVDPDGNFFNYLVNLCDGELGPFTDVGKLELELDTFWSPSINLGVLWHATPWLSWGAVIQSGTNARMEGDYRMTYGNDWQAFFNGLESSPGGNLLIEAMGLPRGIPEEEGTATLELPIPAHFATGISARITPRMKVNLDAKFTQTSSWDELKIIFDRQVDFLGILASMAPEQVADTYIAFPRHYEDTWSWAVGIEYQYTPQWAIRFGYEDRPSAIPSDKSDFLAPFGDAFLVGAGVSFQPEKDIETDLSIGFMNSKNSARNNTSTNVNNMGPNNVVYNPYAGYHTKSAVNALLVEYSYRTYF